MIVLFLSPILSASSIFPQCHQPFGLVESFPLSIEDDFLICDRLVRLQDYNWMYVCMLHGLSKADVEGINDVHKNYSSTFSLS